MDPQILKDIALFLNPLLLAVCAYFLISLHKDWKQEKIDRANKDKEQDLKISGVERDLMEFKAVLPRDYILKDDYIRTISNFEYKIDALGKKIDRLSKAKGDDGEP